jgi:acetyl-CoA acetyltransferase
MSGGSERFEDQVVVSGIGQSEVGRSLDRSSLNLTIDAILAAVADAGLSLADVDGLMTYPGGGTFLGAGFAGPPLVDVYDSLGIQPRLLMGNFEGPAQLGPIVNGGLAISGGLARHVVVYRTVKEGSARRARQTGTNNAEWITALGGGPAPIGYALLARRHFHEYGTTREQLAQIALTARAHARLNPKAVFREPLSLDEYLGSRMIAEPLCLFDCDVHCDGSTAIVLSHAETAGDAPNGPVHLEAVGLAPPVRSQYAQHVDLQPGLMAAREMWSRSDLTPSDVDVGGIYDGFSILTMLWLEALGFCGIGESGPFVSDGRISLQGELPINTDGGQLSGGRLHGLGFVHEMCKQLRGTAGERQIEGARVAVVAVGALPYVGCMLLRGGVG